jgi:hypothetical protein
MWDVVLPGKQLLWSGLEGFDMFPEAFPGLRFLLRSRQGGLPPKGSVKVHWWWLAGVPSFIHFQSF